MILYPPCAKRQFTSDDDEEHTIGPSLRDPLMKGGSISHIFNYKVDRTSLWKTIASFDLSWYCRIALEAETNEATDVVWMPLVTI